MKLEGIKVLDLSQFLPGPTVTQMMADHGAEVIKVEGVTQSEPTREIGERRDGKTVYFANTQRGKRSIALNLKSEQGRDIFLAMAADADVVIESFRPGVVTRLGIDYEAVCQVQPKIVYASISAYGQSGPLVTDPAHDLAVQAMCGLLSNNIDAHGNPVMPGMPAGDMLAATLVLSGVLMALLRRSQTGAGDYLDVSMMDSILSCMPNSMGVAFAEKRPPEPQAERIWGGAAFYRIYQTADDKHVVLGGSEMKFVRNLLAALEREDLIALCEHPPGPKQAPVVAFLEETFRQRSQAAWVEWFGGKDICFAPVNDLRSGLDLEQTRHREMVLEDDRGWEHLGTPLKFAHEPAKIRFDAPEHGADGESILKELGYDSAEVAALRSKEVTR